ncbi:glycoside hydrolase family 30 protein [Alicyclobacillus acidiphilus]|uniref:glycoside hydrolase family 30 protein n=1 Tax=Alicyclobacillus acidiphilus TaxID=182455 RepID=UPI00082CDBE3|nr:glycoside hydrolase family 30 protein [Alicyclobacillus acidiphilus]
MIRETNLTPRTAKVIQTARDTGDRLSEISPLVFVEDNETWRGFIKIYPDVRYQEIEGFGGAFTEAAAVTLAKMSEDVQQQVLQSYFHPTLGIGYSLCRTHIHSCDFALGNYTYVTDGDTELASFSVSRDEEALIPMIRGAMGVEGASFRLFASPWSPPAWMKTNGAMNGGGRLLPEYRAVWADYYVKYIEAYRDRGISIWGLTVQNEPHAVQRWDSCIYDAHDEVEFVKRFLGPALSRSGLENIRLMIWDHNKDGVYPRAKAAYSDPEAAAYIWGTAFHWYSGDHFGDLDAARYRFPDKKLLFTEGCIEGGVHLNDWSTGERYAHHILGDLNHWACGWVDWNLVLDEQGGPNHVGNFCDAPVIADTRTNTLTYENSYYYIGHFSKYVRPGAVRIGCSVFTDELECTAFQNPDDSIVVIVLNRTDAVISYHLQFEAGILASGSSQPHSIQTILI